MVSRTSLYEVIPINHIVFISGDIPTWNKKLENKNLWNFLLPTWKHHETLIFEKVSQHSDHSKKQRSP